MRPVITLSEREFFSVFFPSQNTSVDEAMITMGHGIEWQYFNHSNSCNMLRFRFAPSSRIGKDCDQSCLVQGHQMSLEWGTDIAHRSVPQPTGAVCP